VTRLVYGHVVNVEACDGLRDHWRVRSDGRFVGLVAQARDGWRTLPALSPGSGCGPVCHCPTSELAVATLITEAER
jgi:hypothetical protein